MANTIVVVGAGVSGLTTALLLSENKANKITVVARHMPGDYDIAYASPWAGANVMPMLAKEQSRWERKTWPKMKRIADENPEAGIHFQQCRILRRDKDADGSGPMDPLFDPDPWYKDLMPGYRELNKNELPSGYESGCEFTSVCINTAIYLSWLVGECLKKGVVVKRADLSDINEAKALSHTGAQASVIINATGLGSLHLGGVEDTKMTPARGQIVVVSNECSPMLCTSGTDDGESEVLYIMQRAAAGGTVLGGTYQLGAWESTPDPNIAQRIMTRAVELHPDIAGGKGIRGLKIIRQGVGLRPYRTGGVRIEEEKAADGTWIVHNYGHAGWGYQGSYGCAERVVELVNKIRQANGDG